MIYETEAGVYASSSRGANLNTDLVIGLLRSIDISVSSKGTQLHAELLAITLDYLRLEWKWRPFEPKLAQCSLTADTGQPTSVHSFSVASF